MSLAVVGQRCISEREPELGLGIVSSVEPARIGIRFPATGEARLYARGTPVLKRVQFRTGETVVSRGGVSLVVASIEDDAGLLVYVGEGRRVREDDISDVTSVSSPPERLMAGQVDPSAVFDLRYRTLVAQARFRQAEVRGLLGGRLELIPHQMSILHEVSSRQIPRVLLADEVGLGKTIEACLIVHRLLVVGRAQRVLVLVPESLVYQWFVELLRRFNLWFSIYDEERCAALEQSDPGQNPFLAGQLAVCSVAFLAGNDVRREQARAAGWDILVVDEAHHLAWTPEQVSPEYALVEQLAQRTPGLLLLTATPTQLGLAGHFARLRLLDPSRYDNYDRFVAESERFGAVAEIAERIVEQKPLKVRDHVVLKTIFDRDPDRLAEHLEGLARGVPGAREGLLRTLLDQHGTGRVMFRNTRAAMAGFPKRRFCPVPIDPNGDRGPAAVAGGLEAGAGGAAPGPESDCEERADDFAPVVSGRALLARVARELRAEEGGDAGTLRYSFRGDPRIAWLAAFLRRHRSEKVLLICKAQRKALAIESALQERIKAKVALFHEGLPLVQRDRNAAWFAEPDGAQLLLCSEIGSEGRNFQFAHHLVLFDLPLNPSLLEQRIGRLDRIGQTETIRIHVPYLIGSSDECVVEWYHHGLDAFQAPVSGAEEYETTFRARLLALALEYGETGATGKVQLAELLQETAAFRRTLAARLKRGRDRLLELNSFNPTIAAQVIARIREVDSDPFLRRFLLELLDHFGVRIKEHEEGDVFLDPSHAYLEGFPSIPADGMLATFDRRRAIAREDMRFLSADHALVQDAIDLLVDSKAGTTAFGVARAKTPNLLLEAVFVLEGVAEARWQVDQFLAPTPVRIVVDVQGRDHTDERDAASLAMEVEDADIHRFLERPGFSSALLKTLVDAASGQAEQRSQTLRRDALERASRTLGEEWRRLVDLRKLNDHVRAEEIELAQERIDRTRAAIEQARLRLSAIRLILEGPGVRI